MQAHEALDIEADIEEAAVQAAKRLK